MLKKRAFIKFATFFRKRLRNRLCYVVQHFVKIGDTHVPISSGGTQFRRVTGVSRKCGEGGTVRDCGYQ